MGRVEGILLLLACAVPALSADPSDSVSARHASVRAVRATDPIRIDGILSEPAWQAAPPWTVFHQRDPVEGAPATEVTEVRILYDDAALYVGATMLDPAPDSIVGRLSRKDPTPNSDLFAVYLDPYHDGRTGYYFALDAAGTMFDGALLNDDWQDNTWDGVWEGKVHRNSAGWTAEFRIPFSQLRFQESEVWGVNFERDIARKKETDYLVFTPKNGSGFVSRFANLVGLENIDPPARLAVLPYLTTKAEYAPHVPGDPFNNGGKYTPAFGADLKLGIGTNLTLDAALNPDFGQVELDPAVVNLSDVETFFDEKRPFFLEGASIFNFGRGGANNYWNFNWPYYNIFYSRRIGRKPQGSVPPSDFSDVPVGTTIAGAAKLSGKIGDNWSIGTIQAVTSREYADLQISGNRSRAEIEPLTYYGVFRGLKEFAGGMQGLGFLTTFTDRAFQDGRLRDELSKDAGSMGIDGWSFLDDGKVWVVNGSVIGSRVDGSVARMLALQTSPAHYFQRPDAASFRVDSSATSLSGYAARFTANKQKGNILFNSAVGIVHPGFEINDLGYMSYSNIINAHVAAGYQWVEPTALYRQLSFMGAAFRSWNFDGNTTWLGYLALVQTVLPNFVQASFDAAYNPRSLNDRRTRGGPLTENPPGYQFDVQVSSDNRSDIVGQVYGTTYQADWSRENNVTASVEFRPASSLDITLGPSLDINREYAQWVGAFVDPHAGATFGTRYVFGTMAQKTLAANIRVNWTFTPLLSLQVYLQPLISSGKYSDLKELARPRSFDFNRYGSGPSTIALTDGTYTVDPDGSGPANPFTFSDPDYHIVSLRGNAVLRWEFLPGSTIYFVWTQTRSGADGNGAFQVDRSLSELFDTHPDNIFLVKVSYWWDR